MNDLKAEPMGIIPWVQECPPSVQPVRGVGDKIYHHRGHQTEQDQEVSHIHSAYEKKDQHPHPYDHRRSEIRLEKDEGYNNRSHQQVGKEAVKKGSHISGILAHRIGDENGQGKLYQLRRLDRDKSHAKPPLGTSYSHSKPWDEQQKEKYHARTQEKVDEFSVDTIINDDIH